MGLPAESQQEVVPEVLVVKIQDELTVVLSSEFERNATNATSIGSLEFARKNLSEIEIKRVRNELEGLLSDLGVDPSQKVTEFLEATQPYKPSPNSPLPAIELPEFDPANDNHDLRALDSRLKGVYWVAPIDWDDTLYQTESKNTIVLHQFAKYLRKHHSDDFGPENGNLSALDELIKYCDEWEHERKMVSQGRENVKKRDYEDAIETADKKAAAAFEKMHIDKLKEYGRQFVESEDFGGRFFEYTFPIIQKLRDHGILPVVVTGAPDFLVPALLQKAGLTHGNGTTYDTDDDGRLTGEILMHMGTAEGKRQLGEDLVQKGYAVGVGMGNSEGDMGLFMRAANKDPIKHDVHGGGVLVNGTEAVEAEVERNYSEKRTKVIYSDLKKKDDKKDDTIAAMGVVMKALFYPLHDYLIAKTAAEKGQPKLMEDLKKKLIEQKGKGQIDNIENIKRLRDALKDHGLNQDEITAALCDFLPEIVVNDVMKKDVLYLRDENAVKAWLDKLKEVAELTGEIELTREELTKVLFANSILQSYGGSIPPKAMASGRASTIPPSPPTEDDATYQSITTKGDPTEIYEICTVREEDCQDSDPTSKDS